MATADDVKSECQDFGEEENVVTLKGIPFHSPEGQTISLFIFECVGCEGVEDRILAIVRPDQWQLQDDVKSECQDFGEEENVVTLKGIPFVRNGGENDFFKGMFRVG
ncbi:hypothetical protein CDAR_436151 [Caerostris darwini]|uniref:Uncharacterized protein n=1 Tax=Caerostris darwini TaxID=1538125 RepID=A0AAV4UTC6_9ARAC|nr:hypothetical protein CDAR_436151 [Caerostris darwini]